MAPLLPAVATFAVSTIYVLWQSYRMVVARRERVRRERVAFLLWSAAQRVA